MNSPLLGLDLGFRNTGVALSESGLIATPLTTITWQPPHAAGLLEQIIAIIGRYAIATVVVGIPLHLDETESDQSQRTRQLIDQLRAALKQANLTPEIVEVNEYHTTLDARELYPDADPDAAAAAVLLTYYMEENGGGW